MTRFVVAVAALVAAGAAPPPKGPARDVSAIAFLDRQTGFLAASSPGLVYRLYRRPRPSRIQRTSDGGRTWRTVWTGGPAALGGVAFSDRRHGFVFGASVEKGGALASFLLRTRDGGRTWEQLRPRLPRHSQLFGWPAMVARFPTPRIGFAVEDRDYTPGVLRGLLRTDDAGRTWHYVAPPRSTGVVAFEALDARHVFVIALQPKCYARLWRSDDGGDTWRPLVPCARRYGLSAVDFVDAHTGFLVGGNPYYVEAAPALVVRRTDDGGASWRTVYVDRSRPRDKPFVRLQFVDRRHGWAASGGCKNGQNSPCGGHIWITDDGGRTWRDTRRDAVDVQPLSAREAWAVPPCDDGCGVLFHTFDAGRTWLSR